MAKVSGLDIVFSINGKEVELSSESLGEIVGSLPDTLEYEEIYADLSKATSWKVRSAVAYKSSLDIDTVARLAVDKVEEVVEMLLAIESSKHLSDDQIFEIIDRSPKLAAEVADTLSSFENADTNKLAGKLLTHDDPVVRKALASNWSTPKKILKRLLKDSDPGVVAAAKDLLPEIA